MTKQVIIIVTPWFGEFAGGAEVLARSLAIGLNQRGIETIIFTTCGKSPYNNWWSDYYNTGVYDVYGVETHRFTTDKGTRARYRNAEIKVSKGDKVTEQERKDFFECGINSFNLIEALGKPEYKNVEIIAMPYFHGLTHSLINCYPGRVSITPCFHNEPQFYWIIQIEALLSNSKYIFYNSIEEKEMVIKTYGHRVGRKVVESPVAGVPVEMAGTDNSDRKGTYKLPRDYFVYAGRKEIGKNVPLLCEWFDKYVGEFNRNAKLVFIGGGDASLLPMSDNFLDLGVVSEADKYFIIKNAKALISLSDNESFSVVLMEAWLLGVPVIVSARCSVTRGHVRRSNGGLYVKNADEFAMALRYIEDNPEISSLLASNGKSYVSGEFSFDRVLSKYLNGLGI